MRMHLMPVWVILIVSIGTARAEDPQRHAVVIGINDYADPAVADLKYAESDAKAVFDTLTDPAVGRFPKRNVKLLLGAQASPSDIKAALYGLRGVSKDDLVIIFYSGHGAKEGDEAYWVTQNAQAKALPATALSNTDIRKFIDMIRSERLVILLDCCYAASTVKKDLTDPGKLFGEFAGKGRVTIAGAAENQEALEYADKKAGVFTHFLVAGLRGGADVNTDGVVTFDELWSFLGDNVRKVSVKQGGLHEPKIITEGGITPHFLLTFNPAVKVENEKAVSVLRRLFDEGKITGALYDEGRSALTKPALDPEAATGREIFNELVAGRLTPRFLKDVLDRRLGKVRKDTAPPQPPSPGKPTLAVVPFDVLGSVQVKDAGAILAELLLPLFSDRYRLIDQTQLKHFLDQDDLTAAGFAEIATRANTKSLSKAVKLRAVRYLLVGTVSGHPDGTLSVTARLSDWQTGDIEAGRIAQIGATNWSELVGRLPRLGGSLTGISSGTDEPGALTLNLGGGVTMDLVLIPAGEFMMGSRDSAEEVTRKADGLPSASGFECEHPRHRVRINKPFYLGKYEVTQAQWRAVMKSNPSEFKGEDLPVDTVSWNDCQSFAKKLSRRIGRTIRLPSEAEWEYACRAGTTTPFHFGETISTDQVNYNGQRTYGDGREGVYRRKPMPVGSFAPNALGLYDMHGNAGEWCEDPWHADYIGAPADGSAWVDSGVYGRVERGGSWRDRTASVRSASRGRRRAPDDRGTGIGGGFRVASGTP